MFSVRILVKSKHVRVLLKRFIGQPKSPAAGLTPELYDELLSHFKDTDQPLSYYLVCHTDDAFFGGACRLFGQL